MSSSDKEKAQAHTLIHTLELHDIQARLARKVQTMVDLILSPVMFSPTCALGLMTFAGSSAYSSTPARHLKSKGVLPVKTYLSFKQLNVNAAKSKIAQLNEEIKASSVGTASAINGLH